VGRQRAERLSDPPAQQRNTWVVSYCVVVLDEAQRQRLRNKARYIWWGMSAVGIFGLI